jgi:hypothetical protein
VNQSQELSWSTLANADLGNVAQLTGVSAPYYSISYTCLTHGGLNVSATTGWCGVHAGVTDWVINFSVTVARSPQCDFDSPDLLTQCGPGMGNALRRRP